MVPARNNMFLVCVTVGLVFLASKYRNNVLRSVKHLYKNIKNRDSSKNGKNCKTKRDKQDTDDNNNEDVNDNKEIKLILDKIILADSPEKCDYAVQRIRCDLSDGVLGFDCEWVKEGPVSLLQLATFNGVVALFRIGKIGYIPSKLKELLASKHILKVGVSSFEDGQKIVKDYGCRVGGTLDLRSLAETLNLPSRKSLAAMSLEYLNIEMDKIIEVRCGDWDASTLTDEQVAYAACDALASVIIYHKIMQKEKQKYSLWQRLGIYLYNILSNDVNVRIHGVPAGTVDTRFKVQRSPSADSVTNILNAKNKSVVLDKNDINERKNAIPTRIKPLYHNCYLQAPDGDILCTCDRKKAEWYITKNLGKLVGTDPYTVRLNFEPSGRALGEVGQYYTQVKLNQCVVCGCTEKFIRKNVVPREYRKYFPLVMKAHQSHDVLLLCPSCHEISNNHDLQLRRKLADVCDAPLIGPMTHIRDNYLHNRRKLHSAVKALKEKFTLPLRQREEYENYILEHTGQQKITPDLLNALNEQLKNALIPIPKPMSNQYKYQPHGLKVVQYFQKQEGGLVELERMWREHFLFTMKPKYLPSLWSVRHNQERLIIRQAQNRIDEDDAKAAGLTQ